LALRNCWKTPQQFTYPIVIKGETSRLNGQSIRIALVTGATGFIGYKFVEKLESEGIQTRIYSRQPYSSARQCFIPKERWFTGELKQTSKFISACKGVDAVFHFAGFSNSGNQNPGEAIKVNFTLTKGIYSASAHSGVKTFVYLSSIHAAEPTLSAYATSKRLAEEYLMSCSAINPHTRLVILRPAIVYGPGMKGNLKTFLRLIKKGILPALPKLENSFQMVSVQDLCSVVITVARSIEGKGGNPEIYTVTDNEHYTPNRIEAAAYAALKREKPTFRLPRSVLYLAAIFASLIDWIGLSKNQLGLRLYRSLGSQPKQNTSASAPIYKCTPTATIESEMPKILRSLEEA